MAARNTGWLASAAKVWWLKVKSAVAFLGCTELTKYRILQEEQKTNTAPISAIFYPFLTLLCTFMYFLINYVSKFY